MKYLDLIKNFFLQAKIHPPRSMIEWAEEEIILPTGKRKGQNLSFSYSPFTKGLVEEYQNGDYRRFWLGGSVQSGKTTFGFCLPTIYHLTELCEDVICLVPTMALVSSIWGDKLYPIFRANKKLSRLIPREGAGSRGGEVDHIRFNNGATLRFIAAGGKDAQRSSFTARVIVITETDKIDVSAKSSKETDPIRQAEARSASFGRQALLYSECTISDEDGRIWQEINEIGTGTRVFIQCPHCKQYIYPVKENVKGWQDCDSVGEAQKATFYQCQECDAVWTEEDRLNALNKYKFVHKGQVIKDGKIIGPKPDTNTFGLLYNVIHSPLVDLSYIGEKLWMADRNESHDAKRYVHQFLFSEPYNIGDEIEITGNLNDNITSHIKDYNFGEIHPLSDFTVAALDIQKKWCYLWVSSFSKDLTQYVTYRKVVEIIPKELQDEIKTPTPAQVVNALDRAKQISSTFNPQSFWVDLGYRHEASTQPIIKQWIIGQGLGTNAVIGRSEYMMNKQHGKKMLIRLNGIDSDIVQPRKQEDKSIVWHLNVDRLKDISFASLMKPSGTIGTIYFPRQITDKNHRWVIRHLCAEQRVIQKDKRGIEQRKWINPSGKRNDLWDCMQYSLAGALVHVGSGKYKSIRQNIKQEIKPEPKIKKTDEETKVSTKKQKKKRVIRSKARSRNLIVGL